MRLRRLDPRAVLKMIAGHEGTTFRTDTVSPPASARCLRAASCRMNCCEMLPPPDVYSHPFSFPLARSKRRVRRTPLS